MAKLDPFSAQIVRFVRAMPDEALLELVKLKLGAPGAPAARADKRSEVVARAPKARGDDGPAPETRRTPGRRRAAPVSPERREMLDEVERTVRAGAGISASEVARAIGIPQTRAAAALKQLKRAQRIFQGGDRRFARYAGDPRTAEKASLTARQTAKGPMIQAGAASPVVEAEEPRPVQTPTLGPPRPAPRSTARPRKRVHPAAAPAA